MCCYFPLSHYFRWRSLQILQLERYLWGHLPPWSSPKGTLLLNLTFFRVFCFVPIIIIMCLKFIISTVTGFESRTYNIKYFCCFYFIFTGDTDQWTIPGSRHSFCYQRQPHHQCLQQFGWAFSPFLVHSSFSSLTLICSKHLHFLASSISHFLLVYTLDCHNKKLKASLYK